MTTRRRTDTQARARGADGVMRHDVVSRRVSATIISALALARYRWSYSSGRP